MAQIENAEMSDMDDERCLALDMFQLKHFFSESYGIYWYKYKSMYYGQQKPINLILEKTYILQQKARTKKAFRSSINLFCP